MSRRYQILMPPFEGLNGKLAPSSLKCENLPDGDYTGKKFAFGARVRGGRVGFGIRAKSRNLSKNPYTEAEQGFKQDFLTIEAFCYGLSFPPVPLVLGGVSCPLWDLMLENARAKYGDAGGLRSWLMSETFAYRRTTSLPSEFLNWIIPLIAQTLPEGAPSPFHFFNLGIITYLDNIFNKDRAKYIRIIQYFNGLGLKKASLNTYDVDTPGLVPWLCFNSWTSIDVYRDQVGPLQPENYWLNLF